jgi:glycosyltransferase A (GT-A) superfamily protein (DUF2064 family)
MAEAAVGLCLLSKWPGSGASKTRLTSQLAAAEAALAGDGAAEPTHNAHHAEERARQWSAAFVRAATTDLVVRFGGGATRREHGFECVLLYAPPVDEARAWFATLLEDAGVADSWQLLPVLASSNALAADLGGLLADATRRVRSACSVERVIFCGADCPELPVAAVAAAARAASEPHVAAICPASDGGYTLLALPGGADESRCFEGVKWSATDTCLSQLAALSRAGLLCVVHDTHADVDELEDLRDLATRLGATSAATHQTTTAAVTTTTAATHGTPRTSRSAAGAGGGSREDEAAAAAAAGTCPRTLALLRSPDLAAVIAHDLKIRSTCRSTDTACAEHGRPA